MTSSANSTRNATLGLLLATVLWGCGFTWAKAAGEAVNELTGGGRGAPLGPVWVLAIRFFIAGVFWLIVFPESRRGWSLNLVIRCLWLGGTLTLGMVLQHLGLDRTSEATAAFLTSLTILFVPVMMTLVLRKPPPPIIWIGVILAAAGIWIMTGAAASGLGAGELLSLGCAVGFSINIITINKFVTAENAMPTTAGQFLVLAIICAIACLFFPHGVESFGPMRVAALLSHREVWFNIALMVVFVSMGAFGLQFRFQPRIDPSRAALLYLAEPIFASVYAWIATGRGMTSRAIVGAAIMLVANALVEILQSRRAVVPGGCADR